MTFRSLLLTATLLLSTMAHSAPATVPFVDLERYMGTWYEIEAIPKVFQFGCTSTTAEYSLQKNGTVAVGNSCNLFGFKGPHYGVTGEAKVVDADTNSKLSVTFFKLFTGDYWIFDLADDYSYALVGSPDFDSLWILSRTRTLNESTVDMLKAKARELGFDVSRLTVSKQPAE